LALAVPMRAPTPSRSAKKFAWDSEPFIAFAAIFAVFSIGQRVCGELSPVLVAHSICDQNASVQTAIPLAGA